MRNVLTFGVVGLGSIARKAHLPVLTAHPEVAITGLCSRTGARVDELAARYRLDLTARTFDEILATKPRAAYLLSATVAHAEQAIALLEASIAVFMEKPLANTLPEAEAITRTVERTGGLLMVGFNRRYAPAYVRAKALFQQAGRPVELVVIQKHRNGDQSGWALRQTVMDDTIHLIDLARFFGGELALQAAVARPGLVAAHLEGAQPTQAAAQPTATQPTADQAMVPQAAPLQGAPLVQLAQSYGAGAAVERVELHGGGLTVIVEDLERLTIWEGGVERTEPLFGSWTSTLEKRGIAPELEHFLHCLRTGELPATSAAEALATQRLAEAILTQGGGK